MKQRKCKNITTLLTPLFLLITSIKALNMGSENRDKIPGNVIDNIIVKFLDFDTEKVLAQTCKAHEKLMNTRTEFARKMKNKYIKKREKKSLKTEKEGVYIDDALRILSGMLTLINIYS